MATFKAVVLAHQKRTDDSYNVKIRVTHKRKSKYVPTSLTAFKTDLTRTLEIRSNSSLMFRCNQEIKAMLDAMSGLGYLELESMDVSDLIKYIEDRRKDVSFALDFFEFADEKLRGMVYGTQMVYTSALNAFERYLGKRSIDINDITSTMVLDFVDKYRSLPIYRFNNRTMTVEPTNRKKSGDAKLRSIISCLRYLHELAKQQYNDDDEGLVRIPRSPFKKVRFEKVVHIGQDSLTVEEVQKIIDCAPRTPMMRLAKGVFLASFVLMGMNVADMYEAKYPKGRELVYFRKKTRGVRSDRAEMHVKFPEVLIPYLRDVTDGKELIASRYKTDPYKFASNISKTFTRLSSEVIGRRVAIYSARHTFASLARNECGVEKATVDECLNHKVAEMKLADVYIKRDWERLWRVQESVLGLFRW